MAATERWPLKRGAASATLSGGFERLTSRMPPALPGDSYLTGRGTGLMPTDTIESASQPAIKKSQPRLYGIQGLRGMAVLMVFSVHLFEAERKYSHGPRVFDAWIHGANSGLDLFLVISGFVLTWLAFGHFESAAYRHSYAYNRFTRVYPIYLLYTLPLVPIYLAAPTLFNASAGNEVNLLRTLLLLPDVNLPLIPVAWTLHHEAYFYLVLYFMLFLPERRLPWAIGAFFAATCVLAIVGWHTPREQQGAFEKVLVNPINFNFVFGMVAAWLVHIGVRAAGARCLGLGTVWLIVGYFAYFHFTGRDWMDVYSEVLIFGLPAALITYGVVVLEMEKGWVFGRVLVWVGDAAYSIYLTHVMTVVLAGRIWYAIGVPGWGPHLLYLATSIGLGLLVGKVAYEFVEKPLIQYVRRFDPARRPRPAEARG